MNFLFGIRQAYRGWKAFLFYIIHTIIAVILSGVLTIPIGASNFESGFRVGQIVALVYTAGLTILVVYQRGLEAKYYGLLVVALPAASLSGVLGLVVPAFLTTRTGMATREKIIDVFH
jgi:hypothetical protein